ncbi:hypothetical protein [uncultured Pedobacter sp.]|uniref:hypothetical protein n=1 Tax=uncultured Pedobacter sp. TaxID=246139 RepID=UPI0025DE4474|nr:hypothetical protein [uncultured Pedobacter sp.]
MNTENTKRISIEELNRIAKSGEQSGIVDSFINSLDDQHIDQDINWDIEVIDPSDY